MSRLSDRSDDELIDLLFDLETDGVRESLPVIRRLLRRRGYVIPRKAGGVPYRPGENDWKRRPAARAGVKRGGRETCGDSRGRDGRGKQA